MKLVISTKYSYNAQTGNPNAGGNHRKNLLRALEGSLKRLGTDYIEESLGTLDFTLAPERAACVDAASEPARPFPYYVFADGRQARIQGQANVRAVPANHAHVQHVPAPTQS